MQQRFRTRTYTTTFPSPNVRSDVSESECTQQRLQTNNRDVSLFFRSRLVKTTKDFPSSACAREKGKVFSDFHFKKEKEIREKEKGKEVEERKKEKTDV